MNYKNVEIHNICELTENENGSVSWIRLPRPVYDNMESEQGKNMCLVSTGVELRFVMNSDTVTLRMRTKSGGFFRVYRGSIQGGWQDHEVNKYVSSEFSDFVINKSANEEVLHRITSDFEYPFSPEVIRVIFDRGCYELLDIIGDTSVPEPSQLPSKTLLAYGSSITHGSNSLDMSHSWVSVLAHNLKMDCKNLGMAGSCLMEPAVVEHIAVQGTLNKWDIAVLELGINALDWDEEKIVSRVTNTLTKIAGMNRDKPVYVVSPFYNIDDYNEEGKSQKWRRLIEQTISELNYANVVYINGCNLLGDMSLISADEVHPNIHGVAQIAEKITRIIGSNGRPC